MDSTSQGANDDPLILSDDDDNARVGGSEAPLTGTILTSLPVDMEAPMQRRNVMTHKSLFIDEHVVKRANSPTPGSAMETRRAKKARESRVGFATEASSFGAADDN